MVFFSFCPYSGGNEESEVCELQTAREWSEDEEGGGPDEDEGLASSPSIWGTPRQNSFELTFSYIAIAKPEAAGATRHIRDRRSRGGSRGSRTALIHTDTLETLLDPPDVVWDPQAFLSQEEEEVAPERGEASMINVEESRGQDRLGESVTIQPSSENLGPDPQGRDAGIQRDETSSGVTVQPLPPPHSSQHPSPLHKLHGEK